MRAQMNAIVDISGDSLSDLIDALQKIQDRTSGDATVSISSYEVEVSWTEDL